MSIVEEKFQNEQQKTSDENAGILHSQFTLVGAMSPFFGNHSPKSVKYFGGNMKDASLPYKT